MLLIGDHSFIVTSCLLIGISSEDEENLQACTQTILLNIAHSEKYNSAHHRVPKLALAVYPRQLYHGWSMNLIISKASA